MNREEQDRLHIDYMKRVESEDYPEEPLVPPASDFNDERGSIINILYAKIDSVAVIHSKAGTTRSNHRHSDWHVLTVLSGAMDYWERDEDQDGRDIQPIRYKQGDSVWTKPGKIHKTYFPVDTMLLSCNNSMRTHASHEAGLTRVEF